MSILDSEVYLGDGLFASFDGHMFKLRAPRYEGDHWVALEPAVMYAFDRYRAAIMEEVAKRQIENELKKNLVQNASNAEPDTARPTEEGRP